MQENLDSQSLLWVFRILLFLGPLSVRFSDCLVGSYPHRIFAIPYTAVCPVFLWSWLPFTSILQQLP